jgi:predicted secreted protein
MAGAASRLMLVEKNDVTIAGINSKSVTASKEGIDITTDSDNGYRTFLAEAGTKTLDITFSGVTKDIELRTLIMTEQTMLLTDISLQYPPFGTQSAGDTITGNFYFSGHTENGGGSDGAIEFDGTFASSGPWVYTAGV